jgi:glycogen phosphorylase
MRLRLGSKQRTHRPVAYCSLLQHGIMLGEALPIYSGGLGNVAGDQLKAASDLGVPVVAIGLLYQQGYFRQEFDAHGEQQVARDEVRLVRTERRLACKRLSPR